jgi:hypothetical protein
VAKNTISEARRLAKEVGASVEHRRGFDITLILPQLVNEITIDYWPDSTAKSERVFTYKQALSLACAALRSLKPTKGRRKG